MSPVTHFLASWIIAAKTTDNPRDCRLVTLAGVAPDADGLGLLWDMFNNARKHTENYYYYQQYHHWLTHGAFAAVLTSALLACFARRRGRVFLLCLLVFHLHLLCDLVGSRGPEPGDIWPIPYLGPFSDRWMFFWHGQWRLDGWQNTVITLGLFVWALWMAVNRGESFVAVISSRLDRPFVQTLRKWRAGIGKEAGPDRG